MPSKFRIKTLVKPGPKLRGPLPKPLPPGQLPSDDPHNETARLWKFTPNALKKGAAGHIQEDTRKWFWDRGGLNGVAVAREYIDHPRWIGGEKAATARARIYNDDIVSEVHLLIREAADLREVPEWYRERMQLRQQQADIGYRMAVLTRNTFLTHGKEAMEVFATRAPERFIKFVAATYVPTKTEHEVTHSVSPSKEKLAAMVEALDEELQRRLNAHMDDMKVVNASPGDYEAPGDAVYGIQKEAKLMLDASDIGPHDADVYRARTGASAPRRIDRVMNVIEPTDDEPAPEDFEWD